MSSNETRAPHNSITNSVAATKPTLPSDDAERRPPLSPKAGIRTGVHWRPGPTSAWTFMTEGVHAPLDPGS